MKESKNKIHEIGIKDIDIGDRQRKKVNLNEREALKFSIQQNTLLHPIIVMDHPDEDSKQKYLLVAGYNRLTCCAQLEWKTIPAKLFGELTPVEKKQLELTENIDRTNLTWKERADAFLELYIMEKEYYESSTLPNRFSRTYTQQEFAKEHRVSPATVSQDIGLSEACKKHPELAAIPSRAAALRQLRRIDATGGIKPSHFADKVREVFTYDEPTSALKSIENNVADLIITDIHEYNTTQILDEILRIAGPAANIFIFFHMDSWKVLINWCKERNINYNDDPYLWHQVGRDSFVHFLWLSKNLKESPSYVRRVLAQRPDETRLHSLEKPYALYYDIIKATTMKKSLVVDPICYSPSIVKAAMDLGRYVKAICPNKTMYEKYIINVREDGAT